MKVIGFCGSPRRGGNTHVLMEQALKGAAEKGAETKLYMLNEMNIKGCQACMACRAKFGCPVKDDLNPLYKEIMEADAFVFGSPIYMFQITAQLKALIDRLYPFLNPDFTSKINKKGIMIATQGSSNFDEFKPAVATMTKVLGILGFKIQETIIEGNLYEKGAVAKNEKLMEQVKQAGAGLV
ncbi:MAG: flavodoxin family protein [Firmicutes bacterium]|nr:flavodoxin family protein [Bacillota bacterium]